MRENNFKCKIKLQKSFYVFHIKYTWSFDFLSPIRPYSSAICRMQTSQVINSDDAAAASAVALLCQ